MTDRLAEIRERLDGWDTPTRDWESPMWDGAPDDIRHLLTEVERLVMCINEVDKALTSMAYAAPENLEPHYRRAARAVAVSRTPADAPKAAAVKGET